MVGRVPSRRRSLSLSRALSALLSNVLNCCTVKASEQAHLASHMSQQLSPAPQKAPVVQQSPTAQQPILFGIPIVASGGASQLAPLQYVYLMGSAASDMAGIFANSTLDAGYDSLMTTIT